MRTKTVYTPDYILLIDEDATMKHGDYLLEKGSIINIFPDYLTDLDECQKIIGYVARKLTYKPLENIPYLQPHFDAIKLAKEETTSYSPEFDQMYRIGFTMGVKKVENILNQDIFTKEDIRRIAESYYRQGVNNGRMNMTNGYDLEACINYDIELLTRKNFIPEFEIVGQCSCPCHRGEGIRHVAACCHPKKVLKIIDNQIIGTWR